MNKLIEFFNEKYGDKYGKIPYPRTTIQIYRVYQSIKSYGIKDEELVKLLHNVKLPKPKSIEEKELYTDCLYNKDDSEIEIDARENPVFTGSISLGRKAETTIGEGSYAVGEEVEASGDYSHAEGSSTTASGYYSHAEGSYTTASGNYSHVEGSWGNASGDCSHAEGYSAITSASFSHAEGFNTKASSDYQHVQGKFNIEDSEGKYAHIVGNGTGENSKSNAHTLDWKGNAWFAGDVQANNVPHVVSEKIVLTVPAATITGKKTEIDNASLDHPVTINIDGTMVYDPTKTYCLKYNNMQYSGVYIADRITIAEDGCLCTFVSQKGKLMLMIATLDTANITDMQLIEKDIKKLDNMYIPNDSKVNNSISVGVRIGTVGKFSSSFGAGCVASGYCSHAEGNSSTASGVTSHAEGNSSTASGDISHAEGSSTTASGTYSHAEGNYTKASGRFSHAEGSSTTASGISSHAEGSSTTASGISSHAEGSNTIASCENQHVQGRYNINDTEGEYLHIVGNGSSENNRSNAHTLDWNGNAWYAGKLSQDGTPTVDNDLTTKKYVDTSLENKVDKSQLSFNSNGELVVTINGISKTFVPKAE